MKPILLVDFGSTNTKVTAVDVEDCRILGTAAVYTTVETDINEGLDHGLEILEKETGPLDFEERYACSSAAGGLKMISIGLVPDLTAQASREASLGAGAKVWKTYSFQLTKGDFKEIEEYHPDIILLTGGTDGGNTENILYNAQVLSALSYDCPIVIAGNRNAADQCQEILKGRSTFVCENVMPRLGELNVIPAQKQIREIFLKRIVQGKGLSKAADLVSGIIMPTPSAMMEAMELLAEGWEDHPGLGELVGVDLGGATTDVFGCGRKSGECGNCDERASGTLCKKKRRRGYRNALQRSRDPGSCGRPETFPSLRNSPETDTGTGGFPRQSYRLYTGQ